MTITFDAGITLVFSRDSEIGHDEERRHFKAGDTLQIASIEEHPDTVLPYYTLRTPDGWTAVYVSAIGLFTHVTIYAP